MNGPTVNGAGPDPTAGVAELRARWVAEFDRIKGVIAAAERAAHDGDRPPATDERCSSADDYPRDGWPGSSWLV